MSHSQQVTGARTPRDTGRYPGPGCGAVAGGHGEEPAPDSAPLPDDRCPFFSLGGFKRRRSCRRREGPPRAGQAERPWGEIRRSVRRNFWRRLAVPGPAITPHAELLPLYCGGTSDALGYEAVSVRAGPGHGRAGFRCRGGRRRSALRPMCGRPTVAVLPPRPTVSHPGTSASVIVHINIVVLGVAWVGRSRQDALELGIAEWRRARIEAGEFGQPESAGGPTKAGRRGWVVPHHRVLERDARVQGLPALLVEPVGTGALDEIPLDGGTVMGPPVPTPSMKVSRRPTSSPPLVRPSLADLRQQRKSGNGV